MKKTHMSNRNLNGIAVGSYHLKVNAGRIVIPRVLRLSYVQKAAYLHVIYDQTRPGMVTLCHPRDIKALCPEYARQAQDKRFQYDKAKIDKRGRIKIDALLGKNHKYINVLGVFNCIELVTDEVMRADAGVKNKISVSKYIGF